MAEMPIPEMEMLMAGAPKPPVPDGAVIYYQYCTAIPIATLLAQTWDVKEGEVSYPLTKADLQVCAKRVLSVVMKSAVYR